MATAPHTEASGHRRGTVATAGPQRFCLDVLGPCTPHRAFSMPVSSSPPPGLWGSSHAQRRPPLRAPPLPVTLGRPAQGQHGTHSLLQLARHRATQNGGNQEASAPARRKGATAVQIQRSKGDVESKAGRRRGLYTLVITDKEKAETLTRSLPPGFAEKELK
ncbi:hypothetical protein AB1E18_004636 [Capra hircus]